MFKRYWWIFLIMVVIGPFVGLFCGGVVSYIQPKLYESSATIQIQSYVPAASPQSAERGIATQIELLTSDTVLRGVSEKLDLAQIWALPQHELNAKLRRSISVKSITGTDLLQVSSRLPDPELCKQVTETTVEAYSDMRKQAQSERHEASRAELRDAIRRQEDSVEEKRKVLTRLQSTETSVGAPEPLGFADARADFETSQRLLEQLKVREIGQQMEQRLAEKPVIVHSSPIVPHIPVSPHVPLNLALGAICGLLAGLILALPLMALLNRCASRRAALTS